MTKYESRFVTRHSSLVIQPLLMKKEIQHLPSFKGFQLDVLRLDLLHPFYGGNKYFKLKYNIQKAIQRDGAIHSDGGHPERNRRAISTIITFGGAHSNHIYSTAAYCHELKLKCVGVVRGEERSLETSPTLQFAKEQGMHLHFVSREKYKDQKTLHEELKKEFGNFYLIPEGGNNNEGIKGCSEILKDVPFYDHVFCACGTACTYTGLLSSAHKDQKIIGISVLKGENRLIAEVNSKAGEFGFEKIAEYSSGKIERSTILDEFHFGGYAKHTLELLDFKRRFEKENNIPLDYVYTAKLFYAVYDLIKKGLLEPNKKILIVHSGGSQGNLGYERRYGIVT
jgi:1-aminocyclopropane-1-carboxylate deaminase